LIERPQSAAAFLRPACTISGTVNAVDDSRQPCSANTN
jgi:hypothetical protein